jgi:cell wall assembly regulator SMI1
VADDLIQRLDRWLATNRPEYYALLQPGAPEAELDVLEAKFSVQLPAAFRKLYLWKNGQDPMSSDNFHKNRMFCALEDISSGKEEFDSMIGLDFEEPTYWWRGWIPFLHNGGGSYLCVDMGVENGGQVGQLIAFWKQDQDRPVEYPSVEAWLTELVESMEAGEYEWD